MLFFENLLWFFHDLAQELQCVESISCLFHWWDLLLFFCCSSNQEKLCMIHHHFDLFYDIYSTINKHRKKKLTNFHWVWIILKYILKRIKKLFYNFACLIINHDFHVITSSMHYTFFVIIYERSKVFLQLLIEFSTCQIFLDYLWCLFNLI